MRAEFPASSVRKRGDALPEQAHSIAILILSQKFCKLGEFAVRKDVDARAAVDADGFGGHTALLPKFYCF